MKNYHKIIGLFVVGLLLSTANYTFAQDDEQTGTHYCHSFDASTVVDELAADFGYSFNHYSPVIIGNPGTDIWYEKETQVSYSSYYGKVQNVARKPVFNNSCLRELQPNYPA
jgi:hypothetical protein